MLPPWMSPAITAICVPARTGASRSSRAIGESGSIASMPGTRCALVRFFAISQTTRLKAE